MKGLWSKNLQFWLRNGQNLPRGKKSNFLGNSLLIGLGQDQQKHMCMGESTVRGSVAVAVGVDDM